LPTCCQCWQLVSVEACCRQIFFLFFVPGSTCYLSEWSISSRNPVTSSGLLNQNFLSAKYGLRRIFKSANLRLICSLSLSDLLCGVCGILDHSTVTTIDSCERLASKCLLVTAHLTALLTLLVLAVDHYLAICRPLYHRTDVNVSRVNVTIIVIWIASLCSSSFDILPPVNVCHLFEFNRRRKLVILSIRSYFYLT